MRSGLSPICTLGCEWCHSATRRPEDQSQVPVRPFIPVSNFSGAASDRYNQRTDTCFSRSNPPPGWLYTGVDVMGSLDAISEKLQAGGYDGEYSLQLDLHDLVISA